MKFNDFYNEMFRIGGIDKDGAYGKQCMDLWNYYALKVLEIKGNTGANFAKNILNNQNVMNNMERINNYPEFIPQKGDVAVWTGGKYGHVAICLGNGNLKAFKTMDQNWQAQKLTEEWHNYIYLGPIVFLRPKNQANIKESFKAYDVVVDTKVLNVREGAGTEYRAKKFNELTKNAQEQVKAKIGYAANGVVQGTVCTILEEQGNWGKIPSGWICLDYTKKI